MLLQTNSYIVPRDRRSEHARLLRKFRQTLMRLGCEHFEVYEQVGSNWSGGDPTGRFVQIMRFRDRKHQQSVQAAETKDPRAQQVIQEFCQLINFPYQQQQGLFAVGYYTSALQESWGRPGQGAAPMATDAAVTGLAVDGGGRAESPLVEEVVGEVVGQDDTEIVAPRGTAAHEATASESESGPNELSAPGDASSIDAESGAEPIAEPTSGSNEIHDLVELEIESGDAGGSGDASTQLRNGRHATPVNVRHGSPGSPFSDGPEAMLNLGSDPGEPDVLNAEDRAEMLAELTGDEPEPQDAAPAEPESEPSGRSR